MEHAQYQDSHQAACDWLKLMQERLQMCTEFSGDKHSIGNKLERVQDLQMSKPDGASKVQTCVEHAESTCRHTGAPGRQTIQAEVDSLRQDWERYEDDLSATRGHLEVALQQWEEYEDTYERLSQWLRDAEKRAKDFNLVSTLEEKRAQVKKYQVGGELPFFVFLVRFLVQSDIWCWFVSCGLSVASSN